MSEAMCGCGRTAGSAYLCGHCRRTLEFALQRIPEHALDMELVKAKQTRYTEASGGRGVGHSLPLIVDSRFLDRRPDPDSSDGDGARLLADLQNTLSTWCRVVMDDHPNTRRTRGPVCAVCLHSSCIAYRRGRWPNNTTSSLCDYLTRWAGWVAAQAFGPELLDEMLDLERRLARFVDRPVTLTYAGLCLVCQLVGERVGMYATPEQATVTCRSCGTGFDVAGRRSWMITHLADRLASTDEIRRAMQALAGITVSTSAIRGLHHRGRLIQHSVEGKVRYRIGDVYDLLTARDTPTGADEAGVLG